MKHRVGDLTGALLDAAVAMADGHEVKKDAINGQWLEKWPTSGWMWIRHPATSWSDAGPIIERFRERDGWFGLEWTGAALGWCASFRREGDDGYDYFDWHGPTPLIASMRAIVVAKFGQEVELP